MLWSHGSDFSIKDVFFAFSRVVQKNKFVVSITKGSPLCVPNYAGISLTGYHPPGATNFFVKIPAPGTAFQCKAPAPGSKKRNKIPTPGHNLPDSNAKISMKKEHNSIRAFPFQIFHNCPFDNFLLS